ncbi:hypothetical protein niasHT_031052 [Heterodera trifolii]|uniref:Uncharacterized protein n=1 Tax=Heterodera trifolii TaxID=157864 RepID=A0ABD2I383_9BILA
MSFLAVAANVRGANVRPHLSGRKCPIFSRPQMSGPQMSGPQIVRRQVVNIPSFVVRLDSQKHIDLSAKSPYAGGRPGRVKRKNAKKGAGGGGSAGEEED